MSIFAERLSGLVELRRMQGLFRSEADLAKRILGISPRRMNHYTTGRSVVTDYELMSRICDALRTHPNYLLGWSDQADPQYTETVSKIAGLEKRLEELRLTMTRLLQDKNLPTDRN